jgi:DNA-binding NarL/FixJ family response regulator
MLSGDWALSELGMNIRKSPGSQRHDGIRVTRRQREILELSSKGFTEKEIAPILGLAQPTVRTHLQRFYRSNGLRNKAEAIAFWLRHAPDT